MDINLREDIFQQAKSWVLAAGKHIRDRINDPLTIDTKTDPNDLVTSMDQEIEKFFLEKIKQSYPDHLLLGEEGYGDEVTSLSGTIWIIDPIDGTMNFVHQKKNFAISIGIVHDGLGEIGFIYDVMGDVLYSAKRNEGAYRNDTKLESLDQYVTLQQSLIGFNHFWLCENRLVDEKVMQQMVKTIRGTRTIGSAALELAYVAEGSLDGYLALNLAPWDIAGGLIIVNEVGGVSTDINGKQINLLERSSVVTCNQQIQKDLLQFLQQGKK